jgi:hypothetical protein
LVAITSCSVAVGCGGTSVTNNSIVPPVNASPTQTPWLGPPTETAPPSTPRPDEASESGQEKFEGTAGVTDKKAAATEPALLAAVRTGKHEMYDRIVFEFSGKLLPGYHIEYVDRPVRSCGSGDVVPMTGDGWLEFRMIPAAAHNEQGVATVKERSLSLGLPIVKELKLTCDFEADVTWVAGVASPNKYRVLELTDPARLVVDIGY